MYHRWCIVSSGGSNIHKYIYLNQYIPCPTKSSEKFGVILLSHTKMKTCVIDIDLKIKGCEVYFIFWWWGWRAGAMVARVPALVVLVSVTSLLF
jgi:hypothetical protein